MASQLTGEFTAHSDVEHRSINNARMNTGMHDTTMKMKTDHPQPRTRESDGRRPGKC